MPEGGRRPGRGAIEAGRLPAKLNAEAARSPGGRDSAPGQVLPKHLFVHTPLHPVQTRNPNTRLERWIPGKVEERRRSILHVHTGTRDDIHATKADGTSDHDLS